MEGLRRITLLPAQWLELSSDAFAKKGRLQVGADADIVVFDPKTIAAEAPTVILTSPRWVSAPS